MNNIENFNKKLNESLNNEKNYTDWSSYRDDVSTIINRSNIKDKNILIVGAGNCNDLDLNIFSESKSTTLLDIDLESVKSGIIRQNLSTSDFDLLSYDLTTLGNTDFLVDFKESIENNNSANILNEYSSLLTDKQIGKYHLIIVLPIYTQLLLPQVMLFLNDNQNILNEFLTFTSKLITNINKKLRNSLFNNGEIIIFSDVLEYSAQSEEGKYVIGNKDHKIIIDTLFSDYTSTFGHGLGSFGLLEMDSELKTTFDDYLVWPFDEDRVLVVKAQYFK